MKPKSSSSARIWNAREPVLLDDRFPDREAQVVRVHDERRLLLGRVRPDDVRVGLERVEILVLRQEVRLAEQPRVPIRRPALVHDLAREHGVEIERLLAHRAEDVALPLFELGRVLRDQPEQVALGLGRDRRSRALERRVHRLGAAG